MKLSYTCIKHFKLLKFTKLHSITDGRPTFNDQRPTSHLENFEWPYLRNGSSIHFIFGSSVGFSGSADRMALFLIGPNTTRTIVGKQCAKSKIGHNLKYFL